MNEIDIAEIESKICAARSRIQALKNETKDCMWFNEAGTMKISKLKRLEALNSEIKRLEKLIEHDTPIQAMLQFHCGRSFHFGGPGRGRDPVRPE